MRRIVIVSRLRGHPHVPAVGSSLSGGNPDGDNRPRSIKSGLMAKKQTPTAAAPPPTDAGSEYTVVARRYRPQQFADLIGQEPVAQALDNAIAERPRRPRVPLHRGPRRRQDLSAARILAKALNCVKGPTATPCDECDICQAIADGRRRGRAGDRRRQQPRIDEIRDHPQQRRDPAAARRGTRSTSSTKSTCSRRRRSTPC